MNTNCPPPWQLFKFNFEELLSLEAEGHTMTPSITDSKEQISFGAQRLHTPPPLVRSQWSEFPEGRTILPVGLQPGHWTGRSVLGLRCEVVECCFLSAGWRAGFSSSLRGKVLANHKKPTGDCESEDEMAKKKKKICSCCCRRHSSLGARRCPRNFSSWSWQQ